MSSSAVPGTGHKQAQESRKRQEKTRRLQQIFERTLPRLAEPDFQHILRQAKEGGGWAVR